jgi:hypothetical protein
MLTHPHQAYFFVVATLSINFGPIGKSDQVASAEPSICGNAVSMEAAIFDIFGIASTVDYEQVGLPCLHQSSAALARGIINVLRPVFSASPGV